MHHIRKMAKKLKSSRPQKRDSLGLKGLTHEIDSIIGQIEQIQQKEPSPVERSLGNKNRLKTSSTSPHQIERKIVSRRKNKKLVPYSVSAISKTNKNEPKILLKYSKLERKRQAGKMKMMNSFAQMRNQKYSRGRKRKRISRETNPLKLTTELEDICKRIKDLEEQKLGKTYHRRRQKKLEKLLEPSNLADIRKTMKLGESGSEISLNTRSDLKSNEHLDRQFTMKKCPKCCLYFPLEKIARHCRNCAK